MIICNGRKLIGRSKIQVQYLRRRITNMRGNNFLNIDFGGKRQRPPYSSHTMSMSGNRRAFHYSYNLINNLGNEELKKETVKSPASATNAESGQYESGKNGQRKLSLPTKSYSSNGHKLLARKTSEEIRKKAAEESQTVKRENGVVNFSGNHGVSSRAKNGVFDFDKVLSRPGMSQRFSDPLYEQRSLPPIPFNKPRGGSEGTIYGSVDNLTTKRNIFQSSYKSHSLGNPSSSTLSLLSRKEGLSAVENHEIMQGKMRKKGVVDTTDESHYQRQFLRVLNKRF